MENRSSQQLKGVLDMCLLKVIAEEPCYGYEIIKKLQQQGLDLVKEGSIYPLLGRLEKADYIESYLVPSKEGPKRKYYRLKPAGEAQLAEWAEEWTSFAGAINKLLKGGKYERFK